MDGWIKLHRKCIENNIFLHDPTAWHIFEYLLLVVDRKDGKRDCGRFQISSALSINASTVYKALKRLEKCGMVDIKSNNKYSIISISNWQEYQDDGNTKSNNKVTTKEQQSNNKVTLNKNKELRIKNKELDTEQLSKFQSLFPTKSVKQEYEKCMDYIASTGKTYKDYEAMFRNWLRRSPDTRTPPRREPSIEINQENLDLIQRGKLCLPN